MNLSGYGGNLPNAKQIKEMQEKAGVFRKDKQLGDEALKSAEAEAAERSALRDQYIGSLRDQTAQAGMAADVAQQAGDAGIRALREQAALALAQTRGSQAGRGMGGLNRAQSRQSALSRGVREGEALAETSRAVQAARQQAAGMLSEQLGEERRLLDERQAERAEVALANQAIDAIVERYEGTIATTQSDRDRMIRAIQNEILATATNPAVVRAAQARIAALREGRENTGALFG